MTSEELETLWQSAFPGKKRPGLYSISPTITGDYKPLNRADMFLHELETMTHKEIFAIAANNQKALQTAQEEFMALERYINSIKTKDPLAQREIKEPAALPDPNDHEEMKEATLYGYKYEHKRALQPNAQGGFVFNIKEVSEIEKYDLRMAQDPWQQGGFVPTKREYNSRMKTADPRNPDGWTPIEKNGQRMIPKPYEETEDDRRERYGALSRVVQPIATSRQLNNTPVPSSGTANNSRGATPVIVNKPLRSTRFQGTKVPPTRGMIDNPSMPGSGASSPRRKRDGTPMESVEDLGTPANTPKRKRHNQYTKAKERAELAAKLEAARAASVMTDTAEPFKKKKHPNQYTKARERAEAEAAKFASIVVDSSPARVSPDGAGDTTSVEVTPIRKRHNQWTKAKERQQQVEATAVIDSPLSVTSITPQSATQDLTSSTAQPLKRKRHNQWTKAKERLEEENANIVGLSMIHKENIDDTIEVREDSAKPLLTSVQPIIAGADEQPEWRSLTRLEKYTYGKWTKETLSAAMADDISWLGGPYFDATDPNLPKDIRTKFENIAHDVPRRPNPKRSWAAFRTWMKFRAEGTDKRGPRKIKARARSKEEDDTEHEEQPTTPEEDGSEDGLATNDATDNDQEFIEDEKLADYDETEDDLPVAKRPRRSGRR